MLTEKSEILTALKKVLGKYSKSMKVTRDGEKGYELYGKKKVTVGKKEYDGMFFAASMIQGSFVGFYFFPIYTHPKEFANIPSEIRKCLKGKSCFHIRSLDKELTGQISYILKKGYDIYKKAEWV